MQKVIQRTALAERQAARKLAKRRSKNLQDWHKSNRDQEKFKRRDWTRTVQEAQVNRREDWELGSLAPRRDVGVLKETYGTLNSQHLRGKDLHYTEKYKVLEPWGGRYLNIVKGDRVVILEGRDKGKIGEIEKVEAKRAECTVKGLNMMDVAIPSYMIQDQDQDKRPVRSVEQPIPLSSIRLVFPLTDHETGVTRDVIVTKVENTNVWHDRHTGKVSWSRIIPGLNVKIPWPKKEPRQHTDYPSDTLRLEVEVKSFVPTLLNPPMPGSVIDELRNKYSIFRTRHDPEYVAKKLEEDREPERQKALSRQMETPLKEFNRRAKEARRAKGKGILTLEMLERIGMIIARKKETLAAASMSKSAA